MPPQPNIQWRGGEDLLWIMNKFKWNIVSYNEVGLVSRENSTVDGTVFLWLLFMLCILALMVYIPNELSLRQMMFPHSKTHSGHSAFSFSLSLFCSYPCRAKLWVRGIGSNPFPPVLMRYKCEGNYSVTHFIIACWGSGSQLVNSTGFLKKSDLIISDLHPEKAQLSL